VHSLITLAKKLRINQTGVEGMLWSRLRDRRMNGVKFRRQQQIGNFIVDFACHERMLIVELDGSQHQEQVCSDERRTFYLQRRGYVVLRFWNNDVTDNLDGVLERIFSVLIGK